MLTIFAVPKPFTGQIDVIQRNALESWSRLRPACEILLCGDEEGVAAAAAEAGVRHLPEIALNEYGTPLLDSVFREAQRIAANRLVCYVNADIILLPDFVEWVERVRFPAFVLTGRRRNVGVDERVDFDDPAWGAELLRRVEREGWINPPWGSDFFVFPAGCLGELPPFTVGRPFWDLWMFTRARAIGIPLIDGSRTIAVVHQTHGHEHVPEAFGDRWHGPEGERNRVLLNETKMTCELHDATHVLTGNGVRPALGPGYLYRRLVRRPLTRCRLEPVARALDVFALQLLRWAGRRPPRR